MANGDILLLDVEAFRVKFLDAEVNTGTGVWVETRQYLEKTFHAGAIETGGQVEIMARNDETKPTDATDGPVLLTLTPAVLAGVDSNPWRWIKAKKTEGGTPAATTVIMEAKRVR